MAFTLITKAPTTTTKLGVTTTTPIPTTTLAPTTTTAAPTTTVAPTTTTTAAPTTTTAAPAPTTTTAAPTTTAVPTTTTIAPTTTTTTKAPIASKTNLGLMQVGDNLNVTDQGLVSLGLASTSNLGVVKIGSGLAVAVDGTLSSSASASLPSNYALTYADGRVQQIVETIDGQDKTITITYNVEGYLATVTTVYAGITRVETFNYTGSVLTSITVS